MRLAHSNLRTDLEPLPSRRWDRVVWGTAALLIICAVALVAYFDLSQAPAFNDDWVYAWTARHLALGQGLKSFPEQSVPALVGVFWGVLATGGHTDPAFLRLTAIPFVLLTAWCGFRVSAALGANTAWATVAAAAVVVNPIQLGVATSYMTDTFYLGLLMAAMWLSVGWIQSGKRAWPAIVALGLAILERQTGAGAAAAVAVAVIAARRGPLDRRETLRLAMVAIVAAAALIVPMTLGLGTQMQAIRGGGPTKPLDWLAALAFAPGVIGLTLLPFMIALVSRRALPPSRLLVGAAGALLIAVACRLLGDQVVFEGNGLGPAGLNPVTLLHSSKPQIFASVFPLVAAAAMFSWTAGFMHRGLWRNAAAQSEGRLLLLVAGSQLAAVAFLSAPFERYYLPVAAPLVPLVAAQVSRLRPSFVAQASAGLATAAAIMLYAVGEQDYTAWQVARDRAARIAYSSTGPLAVDAGYEPNGYYAELPLYEGTGRLLRPITGPGGDGLPSFLGPKDPLLFLAFSRANDPAPGVSYRSLAPGRIIIRTTRDPAPW